MRDFFLQSVRGPSLADVSDHLRREVLLEQATSVASLFPLFALTGISTLAILAFGLRAETVSASIDVIGATIVLLYAVILIHVFGWVRASDRRSTVNRFVNVLAGLVGLLGIDWGLLSTIVISATSSHAGRDLLFGIDLGVTSSAVLMMPRRVAIACWVPAATAGLVAAWSLSDRYSILTTIAFLSYAGLIGLATLLANRNVVLRTLSRLQVEEQGSVIGLLLREFEDNASDWLWETDRLLRLTHVSPRLAKVTGRPASSLQGLSLRALIFGLACDRSDDDQGQDRDGKDGNGDGALPAIVASLDARAPIYNRELCVRVGGQRRYWNMICEPIINASGQFLGYRGIGSDITAAKRSQREIAFLARHDVLTGLPNRRLFGEQLRSACDNATDRPFTLLCIDLDRFKDINDRFGHPGGDALLVVVAQRLRDAVRREDIVARLGGDEFAIILMTGAEAEGRTIIARILETLALPLHVQGASLEISASVGAARAPQDADNATLLLHDADLALYQAKQGGLGGARFFDRAMADQLADRQAIEADLRRAIDRDELFVEYQPIFRLPDCTLCGAEALVRWMHPTRGRLGPDRFIPIAEQTGLIVDLGAWVLRIASQAAARWASPIRIAVNVSAVQLRDRNLAASVASAIGASGLPPGRLELEITETALLSAGNTTEEALRSFRDSGIRIALDDFGLGFSSLSHVCTFPFNKIKIAQDFVGGIEDRADKQAVVRAVADLGNRLGLTTTVEGVETEAQLAMLRGFGLTEAQGYLLGRPMSEEAFRRFVVTRKALEGGEVITL